MKAMTPLRAATVRLAKVNMAALSDFPKGIIPRPPDRRDAGRSQSPN
jgi:hypothetical protein